MRHEQHPLTKPVYKASAPEGKTGGSFTLSTGIDDNDLFRMDEKGQLWWKAVADYENPGDTNANNIYQVRITYTAADGATTNTIIHIVNQDIVHEVDGTNINTIQNSGVRSFRFIPRDIPDDQEPSSLASHIISGQAWEMPATGPLTLTWSLGTYEDIYLGGGQSEKRLSIVDTQEEIDLVRTKIEKAMAAYEAAANIRFIEVADTDKGDRGEMNFMFFSTEGSLLTARSFIPPAGDAEGYQTLQFTTYKGDLSGIHHATLVHEIGHALGLKHPFQQHRIFADNDERWPWDEALRLSDDTIMSYYDFTSDAGLQSADINALQFLYGSPEEDWQSPERFFPVSPVSGEPHFRQRHRTTVDENIDTSTVVLTAYVEENHRGFVDNIFSLDPARLDNALFTVDVDDGELRFKASPDYEKPTDGPDDPKFGGNNAYEIIITRYYETKTEYIDLGFTRETGERNTYYLIEVQDVVEPGDTPDIL